MTRLGPCCVQWPAVTGVHVAYLQVLQFWCNRCTVTVLKRMPACHVLMRFCSCFCIVAKQLPVLMCYELLHLLLHPFASQARLGVCMAPIGCWQLCSVAVLLVMPGGSPKKYAAQPVAVL